jgi:hypothetical protein
MPVAVTIGFVPNYTLYCIKNGQNLMTDQLLIWHCQKVLQQVLAHIKLQGPIFYMALWSTLAGYMYPVTL